MTGQTSGQAKNLRFEIVLLFVLAGLWGSSYLFIKIAVVTIPPLTLIAIRVSIAAGFLYTVMKLQGHKLPRDSKTWKMLLLQSFLNSIGAWTVLAWGQQYVDSGLASVLNSTSPIFVFFFTLLFTRHESTGLLKLFGAFLGLFGVVLIMGADALAGIGQMVYAQLAILLGAVMYAGAAIYGKNLSHLPATVTACATMMWASLVLIPASIVLDQPWSLQPSSQSLAAALALAVFCTGIALMIYFRLLHTLGSIGTASQAYLRAGIGVGLGVIFLGEQITLVLGIGLFAAVLGVAAINYPQQG